MNQLVAIHARHPSKPTMKKYGVWDLTKDPRWVEYTDGMGHTAILPYVAFEASGGFK